MERVAVIGAGTMGYGLALEFALAGHPVALCARSPASLQIAVQRVQADLALFVRAGLATDAEAAAALERVRTTTELAAAADGAAFCLETVPEDLALKQQVFAALEARVPADAILATNTSGLSITLIAQGTRRPERVVGAHYINPPHLLPLVEVTRGQATSEETVERTCALLRGVGKRPVVLRQEVAGFITNRLQTALMREVLALIDAGVATPEEIDEVVTSGFGRRLAVLGPTAVADFGGLDVWLTVGRALLPTLSASSTPGAALVERVAAGAWGVKSGRGFHDWPKERAALVAAARDQELLRHLRRDREPARRAQQQS